MSAPHSHGLKIALGLALLAAVLGALGLRGAREAPPDRPTTPPAPALATRAPPAAQDRPQAAPAAADPGPRPAVPVTKAAAAAPDPGAPAALATAQAKQGSGVPPPLSEEQEHSLDVLLSFIFDEGLPDATGRALEGVYRSTWSQAATVRAAVQAGDLDEEQAREADALLRQQAGSRVGELLDPAQRQRLRAAMRDAQAGGL